MSIDSHQDPHRRSGEAEQEGQGEHSSESAHLIVDPQGNPYRHTGNAYKKFTSLIDRIISSIPHGERMMISLTAVVAFATMAQAGIAWYSNHTTGKSQIDQFNQMKSVADRIEGAAKGFAGSAANINQGISDAVGKLNAQAAQTTALVSTAQNMYEATDRPYLGLAPGLIGFFDRSGQPIPIDQRHSREPYSMKWFIPYKNYGSVPAEGVIVKMDSRVNGLTDQKRDVVPTKPSMSFPGQLVWRIGGIENNGSLIREILQGSQVLQMQLQITYSSRGKTYSYCDRIQYIDSSGDFGDLGDECGKPWRRSTK